MYLNGNFIGRGVGDEAGTAAQRDTFSIQSTRNIQRGDQIWFAISSMSTGTYLWGSLYTQFSGYLLEENIS